MGRKAIAELLNREGIPCPSAHSPRQNRHRKMDGWQHSTVVAILANPRYTGYAIYGRWQKVEELLDPEDVAAGYVVRFRRSPQAKIVRSREPAHPAIVSVDTFTAVQLEERRRKGDGRRGWSSMSRTPQPKKRVYLLRSRIRCGLCGRKMEGATRRQGRVRELQDRIKAAEAAMGRLRRALDAGWDPAELREQYNLAVGEKRAAEASLAAVPGEERVSRPELEAMIDGLGDMARALDGAGPEELAELYAGLRLSLTYHHTKQIVDVEVDPLADRVAKLRVRGGTRPLTTRLGWTTEGSI